MVEWLQTETVNGVPFFFFLFLYILYGRQSLIIGHMRKVVCIFFLALTESFVTCVPYLMYIYSSLMKRLKLIEWKEVLFSWILMINSVIVHVACSDSSTPTLCSVSNIRLPACSSAQGWVHYAGSCGLKETRGLMFHSHVGSLQSYLSKHTSAYRSFNVFLDAGDDLAIVRQTHLQ